MSDGRPTGETTISAPSSPAKLGVDVQLVDLQRSYGAVRALDGLSLTLPAGQMVALLGPSGCGKTTALRLLAGLEDADGGHVLVGGKDIVDLPANKRNMGMVFQAYSLFPHMTAQENVEFGLRLRKVDAAQRAKKAKETLEIVGLEAQAGRYAHQMSGGQQQRVALARALAIQPKVLLLDEPLSALDAKVRVQLRDEIRRVQQDVGITTLLVTHDQEEALAVADLVGVMRAGRLEQLGSPADVYARPKSRFVAEFVGLTNRLPAAVTGSTATVLDVQVPLVEGSQNTTQGIALVRPEAIVVSADDSAHGAVGTVITASFLGPITRLSVDLGAAGLVVAQLPTALASDLVPGSSCRVSVRPDPVLVVAA